jgi:hypothetical protein
VRPAGQAGRRAAYWATARVGRPGWGRESKVTDERLKEIEDFGKQLTPATAELCPGLISGYLSELVAEVRRLTTWIGAERRAVPCKVCGAPIEIGEILDDKTGRPRRKRSDTTFWSVK